MCIIMHLATTTITTTMVTNFISVLGTISYQYNVDDDDDADCSSSISSYDCCTTTLISIQGCEMI